MVTKAEKAFSTLEEGIQEFRSNLPTKGKTNDEKKADREKVQQCARDTKQLRKEFREAREYGGFNNPCYINREMVEFINKNLPKRLQLETETANGLAIFKRALLTQFMNKYIKDKNIRQKNLIVPDEALNKLFEPYYERLENHVNQKGDQENKLKDVDGQPAFSPTSLQILLTAFVDPYLKVNHLPDAKKRKLDQIQQHLSS